MPHAHSSVASGTKVNSKAELWSEKNCYCPTKKRPQKTKTQQTAAIHLPDLSGSTLAVILQSKNSIRSFSITKMDLTESQTPDSCTCRTTVRLANVIAGRSSLDAPLMTTQTNGKSFAIAAYRHNLAAVVQHKIKWHYPKPDTACLSQENGARE